MSSSQGGYRFKTKEDIMDNPYRGLILFNGSGNITAGDGTTVLQKDTKLNNGMMSEFIIKGSIIILP